MKQHTTNPNALKAIHTIVKELREDHDYTQTQVAEYLEISQQAYSNYELDRRELPVRHVLKLAELYGVTTDYLLGRDGSYTNNESYKRAYTDNVTIKDMVCHLQSLHKNNRDHILQYITFLKNSQKKKK